MHATNLIHANLGVACQSIHRTRFNALLTATAAALGGQTTSVTGLGRASKRQITEKASIKQMDRLVGNPRMHREAMTVYQAMTHWLLGQEERPVILVDWSPVAVDESIHVLRASVPVGGQGRTLYQECHPQAKYANRQIQEDFLKHLWEVLPAGVCPVIVTDAGFKKPWFRAVEALGWDWVGRARGLVKMTRPGENTWLNTRELGCLLDENQPTYMGAFAMTRTSSLMCQVYGLRKSLQGRIHATRTGQRAQSGKSRAHADGKREPWVIATSLPGGSKITDRVMALYSLRMQIEEDFRASKNEHYGLGVNRSRSRSAQRFDVLLLIAALASFAAWLVGLAAEHEGRHRHYQPNTSKRRVLSHFFLGLKVLQRESARIIDDTLQRIRSRIRAAFAAEIPA